MPASRTVFLFSGQGSQYHDMGRALFEGRPGFRRRMERMDEIARAVTGRSFLQALYFDGRRMSEAFDELLVTHPALFAVQHALAELLLEEGLQPAYCLGSSLGTVVAAAAGGLVSAEEAMTAVATQAVIVSQCCGRGAMLAVFGDAELIDAAVRGARCEWASRERRAYSVLAAPEAALPELESLLRAGALAFQRLPVGHAFHSPWIEESRAPFEACLKRLSFRPAVVPLVSSLDAEVLHLLPQTHFWHVTRQAIRLSDAIALLERRGPQRYVDMSPGGSLTTFLKYTLPERSDSRALSVLSPYGRDLGQLEALLAWR